MKKFVYSFLGIFILVTNTYPTNVTFDVRIKNTPVPISKAQLQIEDNTYQTNSKGQVTIDLDPGNYNVSASAVGYEDTSIVLSVGDDTMTKAIDLDVKIVVQASTQTVTSQKVGVGYQRVEGQSIKRLTEATVIPDVINSLKLLPGVAADSITGSNIYIRGGDQYEVISLIDNVPIRSPYYFGQGNSIFNPKTIDEVEFYPGGYGAEFGQALSGIIDLKTVDGNADYFYGSTDVSLLEMNHFMNSPIIQDKSNITVAFRRTHYDLAYKLYEILMGEEQESITLPSYYSFETKYIHQLNQKHSVSLGYRNYVSKIDVFFEDSEDNSTFGFDIYSDLSIISTQLTSQFSKKVINQFVLARSVSDGKFSIDTPGYRFTNRYNQPQSFIRNDITWDMNNRHQIDFGGFFYNYVEDNKGEYNFIYSNEWDQTESRVTVNLEIEGVVRLGGVYVKDIAQLTPRTSLESGLRLSLSKVESNSIRSYLQPRFTLTYNLSDKTTLKTYAGTYRQILQEANNEMQDDGSLVARIPDLDMEQSVQYGAGFETYFGKNMLLKSEVYHKNYTQLLINEAEPPETIYTNNGKGYANGLEFMLQKLEGSKRHGWFSYTLSETRKYDKNGWYNPEFDLRHMVTLYFEQKLKKNKSIILSVQGRSGKFYTPLLLNDNGTYSEGDRYSKRLSPYIVVDLWYQNPLKVGIYKGVYRVGISNLLNRKNQFQYQFNSDTNQPEITYDFPQSRFLIVGFELYF